MIRGEEAQDSGQLAVTAKGEYGGLHTSTSSVFESKIAASTWKALTNRFQSSSPGKIATHPNL